MKKATVLLLALMLLCPAGLAASVEQPAPVTIEQALEIALLQAGLTEDQVRVTQAEAEIDDGRSVFEIEFFAGRTEYECEIEQATGQILEWDMDRDD